MTVLRSEAETPQRSFDGCPPGRGARPRLPGEQPSGANSWQAIRPAKVARAKELVKDPNYPSAKVLRSVARLLARRYKP